MVNIKLYQFFLKFYLILINMKLKLDKIMNIKSKKDLDEFDIEKPIFYDNYLFHYLIIFDKLDILKMKKQPIYKLNEDGMDGFMLAAKYDNMKILKYLLKEYPDFCQNHNEEKQHFINFIEDTTKIIKLMKEFNKIDWYYLLKFKNEKNIELFCYILSSIDYEDINWFIKKFDMFPKYYILKSILLNTKIKDNEKIKLFDKFSEDEINLKDLENNGLLIDLINLENVKLTELIIKRNLHIQYIINPVNMFITPFYFLYSKMFIQNNPELEKIMEIIWKNINKNLDFSFISKDGLNYVEMALNTKGKVNSKILEEINDFILLESPDDNWNRINPILKTNVLFLVINKPFDKFKKYLIGRKVDLEYRDDKDKTVLDYANKDWKDFLVKLDKYKFSNNIDLEVNKYQHNTKFTAQITDILLYFIYLDKKYENLYIPKVFEWQSERTYFPWFVSFIEPDTLDIHPKINSLINIARREKSHDFAVLFLSLTLDHGQALHANILIYDFNNLTIERFEPYGDLGIDEKVDAYLEEELTWNTGFKYLRPKDFMTKPGYQLISNENKGNFKSGDFGGFCLGWCIWYLEHRMKNVSINPKVLNEKTIEKMLRLDDTFTEYIRNYSNKLFDCKLKLAKNICIGDDCVKEKNISNLYLDAEDERKIIAYTEEYFEYKRMS